MLGYGKDSHSYKVFNLFHYKMVETVNVRFDETNGSQREHLPNVLDEVPPNELVKHPDPRKHNIIGTKWIYRIKQDEHGQVVRNKARLVAQGCSQVEGVNFEHLLRWQDLKPFGYC